MSPDAPAEQGVIRTARQSENESVSHWCLVFTCSVQSDAFTPLILQTLSEAGI